MEHAICVCSFLCVLVCSRVLLCVFVCSRACRLLIACKVLVSSWSAAPHPSDSSWDLTCSLHLSVVVDFALLLHALLLVPFQCVIKMWDLSRREAKAVVTGRTFERT